MQQRVITENLIQGFREYLYSEEKSENTEQKYIRDVRAFAAFADNQNVCKEIVIKYKEYLLGKNYAVRSINSMLASLNSLFSFLSWNDCKVKAVRLQKRIYCPKEEELTRGEYIKLCRTAEKRNNERLNLILQTICGTGIRISELQFITVEAVKCGQASVSCKGKLRIVFIVKKLRKKLLQYALSKQITSGCIFVTRTRKRVSRTNVWREMKNLCAEAEVSPDKVFPHNLRHLFARTFYEMEKDLAKLADILGHSSMNTTRIYIISTGTEHRRQLENMRLIGSVKNFVALVKNGSFLVRITDMTILIEKEFIYGSSKRPNPTDYYRKQHYQCG